MIIVLTDEVNTTAGNLWNGLTSFDMMTATIVQAHVLLLCAEAFADRF
jgi:hypothetical protein